NRFCDWMPLEVDVHPVQQQERERKSQQGKRSERLSHRHTPPVVERNASLYMGRFTESIPTRAAPESTPSFIVYTAFGEGDRSCTFNPASWLSPGVSR